MARSQSGASPDVTASMVSLCVIDGVVSAPPTHRDVGGHPSIELDVKSHSPSGAAVSVSVVKSGDLPIVMMGDTVLVVGAARRRFFRASGATVTRTEVEASTLLVNPDKRKRNRALKEVLELLKL
jgi:hypothetical protein